MKSLSVQVRDAIEACGLTRFALSRESGVSESVLSRFIAGKQDITLSTLDKIAKVLGLHLGIGVQAVSKSPSASKPGRPKKAKPMQKLDRVSLLEWKMIAAGAAYEAHEKNFSSRRGLYIVEKTGIVYYDNNCVKSPREADPREYFLRDLKTWLRRSGYKVKAESYWPREGESKDYTYAMAIQCDPSAIDEIQSMSQQIYMDFLARIWPN